MQSNFKKTTSFTVQFKVFLIKVQVFLFACLQNFHYDPIFQLCMFAKRYPVVYEVNYPKSVCSGTSLKYTPLRNIFLFLKRVVLYYEFYKILVGP